MKYICELDGKVFTDYDDVWDHVADWFTNDDFIDYAKKIGRFDEMMDDLMDHDTDLAQEIHGRALEEYFMENVSCEEEDEEPCCATCGQNPSHHCYWCEEYSEFKKKDW